VFLLEHFFHAENSRRIVLVVGFIVNMTRYYLFILCVHVASGVALELNFSGFESYAINLFPFGFFNAELPLDPNLDLTDSILISNQKYLAWRIKVIAPLPVTGVPLEYLYREACSVNTGRVAQWLRHQSFSIDCLRLLVLAYDKFGGDWIRFLNLVIACWNRDPPNRKDAR